MREQTESLRALERLMTRAGGALAALASQWPVRGAVNSEFGNRQSPWSNERAVHAGTVELDGHCVHHPGMKRRRFVSTVLAGVLAGPLVAWAQRPGRPYRIGFIVTGATREVEHLTRALDDGLREMGYVEGRDILVERRFAGGQPERLPGLAAELVQLDLDVIVTGSNPVVSAVRQATGTIPIVMAVSRDPVGAGFIANLARPGGNITGLTSDPAPEILAKNLQLLKEAVPAASRVAVLWNPSQAGAEAYWTALERAARELRVAVHSTEIRGRSELERAFGAMARARVHALVVIPDPVVFTARAHIATLVAKHRLPSAYAHPEHVESGGLLAYGSTIADQFHRAATYVDKILRGAKPADLPVEQPTRLQLVVNLKTATALGLTVPPSLLARADKLIE